MIHVQGIEKQFGTQTLFRDLSWHIKPGQRVGLVGPNGAGKSTLIKIIMGQETCDGGDVIISRYRSLGDLPQDVTVLAGRTVRQEVREGLSELLEMETQIRDMEAEMASATGSELDNLMTIYGDLQAQFERDGGFQIEHRVESVLSGLGFSPRDFDRDCSELSGGWQMRTVLAKLLLQEPDILFLDEPTNHLDLESLIWLEGFLQDYPGSLVFISHDRWFLNRLSSHIAELSRRELTVFTGNFDSYIQQASEDRNSTRLTSRQTCALPISSTSPMILP